MFEEERVAGPMVSITFDTGDVDQCYTYEIMRQAHQMREALDEMASFLRTLDKHCIHPVRGDDLTIEESDLAGHVRDRFYEILQEVGID